MRRSPLRRALKKFHFFKTYSKHSFCAQELAKLFNIRCQRAWKQKDPSPNDHSVMGLGLHRPRGPQNLLNRCGSPQRTLSLTSPSLRCVTKSRTFFLKPRRQFFISFPKNCTTELLALRGVLRYLRRSSAIKTDGVVFFKKKVLAVQIYSDKVR